MFIPYSEQYGAMRISDDLAQQLRDAGTPERLREVLNENLAYADSPYTFWSLLFSFSDFGPNKYKVRAAVLDYIVEHKNEWDDDQVACFLLQVADDAPLFSSDAKWLLRVNMPDMLELEWARPTIWEMFCGPYAPFVMELSNHYGWNEQFASVYRKRCDPDDPEYEPENRYLNYALVRMIEAGCLDDEPERSSATWLAEALRAIDEQRFYQAIPMLLEFHDRFPKVAPREIQTKLAICYLQVGWRGLALEWVLQALKDDVDDLDLQALQKQILSADEEQLGQLKSELEGKFGRLAPEALDALVLAEFLYRYYGRMLYDYSPIISGYARSLEIPLRQLLLPQVRTWINMHGSQNKDGRHYIRIGEKSRMFGDCPDESVTLGTWAQLFDREDARDQKHVPGEFYHCIHILYGCTVNFDHMMEFGKLLAELTEARNLASHDAVHDWQLVTRAREIVTARDPLSLLRTTKGSMIR